MTDQSLNTVGATPTDLPPLPEGFALDVRPAAQPVKETVKDTFSVPSLPDGFKLDQPSASPVGDFKGVVERGNIDLTKRPVVKNDDGTISTVRSMSFEENGKEILVPTVSDDGKILTNDEAINQYHKTGKHLGVFDNADDATAYAQALHDAQDAHYSAANPKPVNNAPVEQQMEDFVKKQRKAGTLGTTDSLDKNTVNFAKGLGENIVKLEGSAVRGMSLLPGNDPVDDFIYWLTGKEKPANYPTPERVNKATQEVAKQMENVDFGFDPGDTWEDVKKAPASKFIPWALKNGLLSAPDMAAMMVSFPGYAAVRAGSLAQQRAQNDQRENATVGDMLVALPASTASALLDRIGAKGMFGIDEAAVQSMKQLLKEGGKAATKEGTTEAAQQVIEDVATDAGTKKGFDPKRTAENALASFVGGSVFGGVTRGVEGATELNAHAKTGKVGASDLPPLPEGFTLDPTIQKTDRLPQEGKQGETVETSVLPGQAPVTRDGSEEKVSPPESLLPSISPEERAILRRTSIPDEDIDAMSRPEIEQKVAEARAANIKVNPAMINKAAQYSPPEAVTPADAAQPPLIAEATPERPVAESVPIPEARPVLSPEDEAALQDATKQSVAEDRQAQIDRAVNPEVQQQLAKTVQDQLEQDRNQAADQALAYAEPDLSKAVQQSVDEDLKGDGTRQSPVVVQQPAHIDVAAQQVNTEPSDAQREANNYKHGHIKISGIDITLENPKGSLRSGVSPKGERWQVEMPAHYGYAKGSVGRDGDQVDTYIGDNPQSKRVYVIDQKDLNTRRFDEHKAVLGVNSVTEARDLYARGFSDGMGADRIGGITPMTISEFRKWLASDETTKPLAMGKPKVRTNEEGFPIDINGNVKKPDSLIEFLARKGGVREDHGELSVLGLRDRKSGFVVGAGPLIRRNGMTVDKAREAAAEAGYLPMVSSLKDFYDALDQDARSGRQVFSQYDDDHAARWREAQGGEARKAEEDASRSEAYDRLKADGFPVDEGADYVDRVAAHMANGQTYEDAVELAYQNIGAEQPEVADIPFFGEDVNETVAGTAPVDRAPSRAEGERDQRSIDSSSIEADRQTGQVRGEGGPEVSGSRGEQDGGRGDQQGTAQREKSQPQEPVAERGALPSGFTTSMGSTYTVHEDGTTTRDKAARSTPGHEGDSGLKARTEKTIYTDANAGALSAAGLTFAPGSKGARVVIRNGKASLATWNVKENRWGVSEGSRDIQFFNEPAVGRYPLELWKSADDVPGYEAYAKMHAGNKITEISSGKEPVSEAGADNKQQLVIPGAERASDATMAQRGADAALKPKVAQKEPAGLFSDERNQGDLLDLAKKPAQREEAKVEPAEPEAKAATSEEPKKLVPPSVVYHGTSTGGFDAFDTYQGKYGLFGSGGYFTEDPNIALEYTRKGRGEKPTVYSAKLNVKNALDMDAKADVAAWEKAFPDHFDPDNLPENATNEQAYREVEEMLSQDMIPDYEGAETMQDGVQSMGYDAITHIGGGRHKASKGTKHRVWIVFDPEQVTNFKEEERHYSANPAGWDTAGEMDAKPLLSKADQRELVDIVRTTAGLDPEFVDTIKIPEGGAKGWGNLNSSTAAGAYSPMRDIVTLALDSATKKSAQHESFHRLQNLFLTEKERRVLKAEEPRLRKMIADSTTYGQDVAAKMSRKEVEAEAYAMWATAKKKQESAPKIHIALRKAWNSIATMLERVRNYLNGRGFQTLEDVFGKAKTGEIAKRPKRQSQSTDTQYAITDERGPVAEPDTGTVTPGAAIGTRINDYLNAASKALASKIKSKGSRFDRSTAEDGETTAQLAHRKIVDYLSPVKQMQEKVGGNLNDLANAYQTARLAEGTIRHEIHQIDDKYVTPAVDALAAVGASLEDLHKYMYAMHVPERNRVVGLRNGEEGKQIEFSEVDGTWKIGSGPVSDGKREQLFRAATDPTVRGASGMSTNEAKDIIRELSQDREKFMGIRRAASHIRAMLDNSLETQLKNGLINKETYDRLTSQWQNYVPLRAESDEDGVGGSFPSKSRGFDVRGDEFKGATGRFTPADNVVVYSINNAEQSVIRGEKNKAATAALRFINQFDPKGENIAQVYWSDQPEQLGDITKAPAVYRRVIGSDGKVTQRKVNDFQMRDDVLAAKVGGKTYYMRFADPKVGLALKKMTFSELGVALKLVKTVSNWQSLINTRANPAFIPLNLIRDVQTGATLALSKGFSTGEIAKTVGNIPNAWGALWRHARGKEGNGVWDTRLQDFMSAGGKISFDQYNSIEDTLKKLQKDVARRTGGSKPKEAWNAVVKLVTDLNDTIENGMRLAVFSASRARGDTSKQAAFLARDLTVDFQKKGEIAPSMNALYTFFNASVQGNYNFAKGLVRSRKVRAAMMGLIVAGYAQHLWNLAMAGDDDDGENAYKKMLRNEPWKFERQMVFFLPGRKDYITIPLGFGLNAFWHLGVEGGAVTSGVKGFLPAALDSTRVAFDAFNPLGSGGWVGMVLPSIIDPIWELGTNQDFTGRPIYPSENQFDPAPPPKSEQAFKSTAPAFKVAAKTLNSLTGGNDKEPGAVDVYPDSLEYLWGWFSGGLGRFVSQSGETAQRAVNLEFEPKKTPFIRSFYGETDDQTHRAEYYNERERVQYAAGKMKEYEDAGNKEDTANFLASHKQDLDSAYAFEQAEKQRKKINKERRQLEKSKMPQDKIDNELDRLNDLELEIMDDARKEYFKAQQKAAAKDQLQQAQ
jgi:hypothetical protein